MLSLYPQPLEGAQDPHPVWIDLCNPTPSEIDQAEALAGAPLPSRNALSEIEMSSRLRRKDGVLTMSTPTAMHRSPGDPTVAPVGFVLSRERLVTIRYADLPAFDAVAGRIVGGEREPGSGLEVLTELCEEIVDHIADGLEHLAEELSGLSIAAFHTDDSRGRHASRSNRVMRIQLRQVGRLGERLSEVRDGMLGLTRVLSFTEQFGIENADEAIKSRLTSLRQDLASLSDYDEHLTSKVQFVLDALVGLIGIVQNDIFKVLTIVSIAGIPPTLVAGIYGMNFKNIPEYNWSFGYQYGLAIIVLSTVLPLIWFKVKGWF